MKLPSLEDYEIAIDTQQLIKAKELKGGRPDKQDGELVRYVGGFCVVFPYYTTIEKVAVRCWFANVSNAKDRTRIIAEKLQKINLPYFVGFKYIEQGLATNAGILPIVLMDWVEAIPIKTYIAEHINDSSILIQLAHKFKDMVADLHRMGISHGDLQHGNILVYPDGRLVLVDYDSMFVPGLEDYDDEIKGLEGYQHPARWANKKMSKKADYFSELVIFTSILAFSEIPELWVDKHIEDTETMLFSPEDIKSGGSSPIFTVLDTNPKLVHCSTALKVALRKNSIDELIPLEDALVSYEQKISTSVRGKWKDNGYESKCVDYTKTTGSIKDKWHDNGYVAELRDYNVETKNITNKW